MVRYSGGSRCLPVYQDFPRGSKLVYLVDDPAGVFLYPVIFIDMGWRTRTISDTQTSSHEVSSRAVGDRCARQAEVATDKLPPECLGMTRECGFPGRSRVTEPDLHDETDGRSLCVCGVSVRVRMRVCVLVVPHESIAVW